MPMLIVAFVTAHSKMVYPTVIHSMHKQADRIEVTVLPHPPLAH